MKIKQIVGYPGCGKTRLMATEIVRNKGQYILVTSRVQLIDERERDLRALMADHGARPTLRVIYSGLPRRAPVRQQIEEAISEYRHYEHVILLITHEGMMSADLGSLAGWRVMIDELPGAVVSDDIRVEAAAVYLKQSYELRPIPGTQWSKVEVRDDAPDTRSVIRDGLFQNLVTFDKRARTTQGVYVDAQDWADLRGRGRKMSWWSAWTLLELKTADSVTIAGAGYEHSMLAQVTDALYPEQIEIEQVHVPARPRQRRRVLIHYFAEAHRGSTTFWDTDGRDCLLAIRNYLGGVPLGFWSGNEVVTKFFHGALSGEMVSPKTEGTNSFMHHQSCAFIYSSKALPSDKPLIRLLGLSMQQIERAREIEDIIQFVFRGDLRNPDSTADYTVYLYDRHQAEALGRYITEQGLGTVELVPVVEAGLLDIRRPARGRPASVPVDQRSQEDRKKERRAKNAEAQKVRRDAIKAAKLKEQTYRGRGRPKKGSCDPNRPEAP